MRVHPGRAEGGRLFDGLLEVAPLGHAGERGVLLATAENQKLRAAQRARLGNRLLPAPEVALDGLGRIVRAAVEALAAPSLRLDLDDVSAALRAVAADRHRLRVLSARVARAGQELPVAA